MGSNYGFGDFDETHIMKYGWYEFFSWSDSEIVYAKQNDHLQFDCTNHNEMIEYENEKVRIDTWFLQVNKNTTFFE